MLARVLAVVVCLSVCLSHADIVSKRLNLGSRKQCHMIAQGLWFFVANSIVRKQLQSYFVWKLPAAATSFLCLNSNACDFAELVCGRRNAMPKSVGTRQPQMSLNSCDSRTCGAENSSQHSSCSVTSSVKDTHTYLTPEARRLLHGPIIMTWRLWRQREEGCGVFAFPVPCRPVTCDNVAIRAGNLVVAVCLVANKSWEI